MKEDEIGLVSYQIMNNKSILDMNENERALSQVMKIVRIVKSYVVVLLDCLIDELNNPTVFQYEVIKMMMTGHVVQALSNNHMRLKEKK